MRVAIFGRVSDKSSLGRLILFLHRLREYKEVEFYYWAPFKEMLVNSCGDFSSCNTFNNWSDLPNNIDLFLSLGGDGTFLESVTYVRDREIPIAGINFGRLGFLTTACVEEHNPWIEKLLSGKYAIEERVLLNVEVQNMPNDFYPYALNEFTIQHSTPAMLEIELTINGAKIPKYWADGIVIAGATGSTAYSLSIGAPIVTPDSKVLIIAPIAPHNLNVRPLVVPDSSLIEISFSGRNPKAILTADNRFFDIESGGTIKISKAEFNLKSVSINNNFIEALNRKLLWGEDKRNMQ